MLINSGNLETVFTGFKAVFNETFEATPSHIDTIAMRAGSTTSEEEYGWLGQFPDLREWIGDRVVNGIKAHGFKIKNKKFESTVSVERDDLSDDKFGLYKPLFGEMGRVTKVHPDQTAFALLKTGFATKCYDGQNFFDTDHPFEIGEGAPETVSNMQDGAGPAWYLIDASRGIKPLVWQEREPYDFQTVNAATDHQVFMTDKYLYGVRARVNCGFGLWQLAFASKADLSPANYAAARQAMIQFTGDRGQVLGVTPTHLIVPPSLEQAARQLLLMEFSDAGSSNIWFKTADLIISPYVS